MNRPSYLDRLNRYESGLFDLLNPKKSRFFGKIETLSVSYSPKTNGRELQLEEWGLILIWVEFARRSTGPQVQLRIKAFGLNQRINQGGILRRIGKMASRNQSMAISLGIHWRYFQEECVWEMPSQYFGNSK